MTNTVAAGQVHVLLCGDLETAAPGPRLADVAAWTAGYDSGAQVRIVPALCRRLADLGAALRGWPEGGRLALGLCSGGSSSSELRVRLRYAGLDPLGVQVLDLSRAIPAGASRPVAEAVVETALVGAIARARAFRGSRPENTRAVIIGGQEKVSRRALFTLPPVKYEAVPTVDRDRCAAQDGCRQCVGACPRQALKPDGGAVTLDRGACVGCGVCLAVCPHRAVDLPGSSAAEIEAQVDALLTAPTGLAQRAIAFACRHTPSATLGGWFVVEVPCVGMVPAAALLGAVGHGAAAVAVSACGEGCESTLEARARGVVDYCRQVVAALGGDPAVLRVLDGGEAASIPLVRATERRTGAASGPGTVFARGAAAQAVLHLADQKASPPVRVAHPASPLGLVSVRRDACTACGTCSLACPTGALSVGRGQRVTLRFDPALCTGCGECAAGCPERAAGAISVERVTDTAALSSGPRTVYEEDQVLCRRCGEPVASRRVLDRLARSLGADYRPELMEYLCTACRGAFAFGSGAGGRSQRSL